LRFGNSVPSADARIGTQSWKLPYKHLTLDLTETLDLFFASSVAALEESCTKNEQNRICRSNVFFCNFHSHHFSVRRVLMIASTS
jgi:hypothetical protein